MSSKHVLVLVLGDAGRSPRMQYHALSLLQRGGCDVTLCGYAGARLIPQLEAFPCEGHSFTFCPIPPLPRHGIVATLKPLKAIFQFVALLTILLFRRPRPDVILLQIPPAIPTMLVCIFVAFVRRIRLVFDWHNFGHTLMGYDGQGRQKPAGTLQRVARAYETFLAPMADGNLCVTKAMQNALKEAYRGTDATVFYDRPKSDVFTGRTGPREGVALLEALAENEDRASVNSKLAFECLGSVIERMRQASTATRAAPELSQGCKITTRHGSSGPRRRAKKSNTADTSALLMVSSTSWTPDEDFSILLDAMVKYDARAVSKTGLPPILLFVTGKGPLKEHYEKKIDRLNLSRVAIRTVWLEPEDYPKLLGCADLGISLHASSSGVDLPMKVVDMFGARTPVAALGYPCLAEEMVTEGKNGVVFGSSGELCDKLERLLENDDLARMQQYVSEHAFGARDETKEDTWEEAWEARAMPVILG